MVANNIREVRERAGISQTELSRLACIGQANLCAIENCRMAAWPKARRALAKALKVKESDLFPEA